MKNKKKILSYILYYSGFLFVFIKIKYFGGKYVPILAYHKVMDIDDSNYPFDKELISASSKEFKKQINFVSRFFNDINFNDLISYLDKDKKLPNYPLIVSFDDGHYDNYEVAYPILLNNNVSATIFISTGYIEKHDVFWFDLVAYVILNSSKNELDIGGDIKLLPDISDSNGRQYIANEYQEYLKRISNDMRILSVKNLVNTHNITIDKSHKNLVALLSWDNICEMSKNKIEFGSHTVTHPVLSQITNPDELNYELEMSKIMIQNKVGNVVNSIAYPVGQISDINEEMIELTKKYYSIGTTYVSGINELSNIDRFKLKRLHVERDLCFPMFVAMLCFPNFF